MDFFRQRVSSDDFLVLAIDIQRGATPFSIRCNPIPGFITVIPSGFDRELSSWKTICPNPVFEPRTEVENRKKKIRATMLSSQQQRTMSRHVDVPLSGFHMRLVLERRPKIYGFRQNNAQSVREINIGPPAQLQYQFHLFAVRVSQTFVKI